MHKHAWALIALLLISPFIGELVTGNTPLLRFLTPPIFLMAVLLYGLGAVLIRETAARWRKGLTAIVLLGLANGAIEEGLVTRGFFDPHFYAVIAFGMERYGRLGGINAVWALSITLFHAIFSITIPIVLFNLFLAAHGDGYAPDSVPLLLVWALIVFLLLAAYATPEPSVHTQKPANPWGLFPLGAVMSTLYFVLSQGFHHFMHDAVANFLVLSVFALGCGWIVPRLPFSPRGTVAMAAGFLVPMTITRLLAGALAPVALVLALIALALFKADGDLDAAGLVPDRPGKPAE